MGSLEKRLDRDTRRSRWGIVGAATTRHALFSFTLGLVVVAVPRAAVAEEPSTRASDPNSAFAIHAPVDIPLTLILLQVALTLENPMAKGALSEPRCTQRSDSCATPLFDERVLDNKNDSARKTSDFFLSGVSAAPFVLGLVDAHIGPSERRLHRWTNFLEDSLIVGQAMSATYATVNVVKYAVRRPRPLVYNPEFGDARHEGDASLSFPSGHAAISFAAAVSYSYVFMKRHPDHWAVYPTWAGLGGAAATTAVLRTVAGKHFWTDILTGAAIGSAYGVVIPWAHERSDSGTTEPRLAPLPVRRGGGLMIHGTL